jgi:hypothetical protein
MVRGKTVSFRPFVAARWRRAAWSRCLPIPDGAAFYPQGPGHCSFPQEAAYHGAKGVAWARIGDDGTWSGPVAKNLAGRRQGARWPTAAGVGPGRAVAVCGRQGQHGQRGLRAFAPVRG